MKTILITGATNGMGQALAHLYHERGERLVLVGRRSLNHLNDHTLTPDTYIETDLSQSQAAQTIADWLTARGIDQLDVLIHNAGLPYFGAIDEQSVDNILDLTAVNLTAPVMLTHTLLPRLKAAKGKVVFISSVAAALPAPEYAVYVATKAALDGLAYNLRIELDDEVDVQLIHPGATQTDMHRKAGIPAERMDTSKYPTAAEVAAQIAQAVDGEKEQVTIGFANKLMRFAGKHAARLVDVAMKGRS